MRGCQRGAHAAVRVLTRPVVCFCANAAGLPAAVCAAAGLPAAIPPAAHGAQRRHGARARRAAAHELAAAGSCLLPLPLTRAAVQGAPPVLVPGVGGYGGGVAAVPGSAMAQAQATAAPGSKVVHVRTSAGEKWVDATLAEWPESALYMLGQLLMMHPDACCLPRRRPPHLCG